MVDYTPTPDQIKDGWTEEKLREYHESTQRILRERIWGEKKPPLKTLTIKTYDPHNW